MNLPTIKQLTFLIVELKDVLDRGESGTLTIGWSPETGDWDYQTGDNSFSDGAYNHPIWAVVEYSKRGNSVELAREIRNQLVEAVSQ